MGSSSRASSRRESRIEMTITPSYSMVTKILLYRFPAYCFGMRTATAQCFGLPSTISYLDIVSLAPVFFWGWDAGSKPGRAQA